jgi:hypothetical protein
LGELGKDIVVTACTVRDQTPGAILDSFIGVGKIAAALITEGI